MNVPRRAKTFKSGNSVALRLPKDLGFEPGAEFEIVKEDDGLRLRPVARKIDVSKFIGKAPWLKPIPREDFDDLPRDWHLLDGLK